MEFSEICNVLLKVCRNGKLFQLKTISNHLAHVHVKNKNNEAFRLACENGHLEVANWLVDTFGLTVQDARCDNNNCAFHAVCCYGRLEVLKWFVHTFGIIVEDASYKNNYTICYACCYGRLKVSKWLVDTFKITISDEKSDNNYAKWLLDTFKLTIENARTDNNNAFHGKCLLEHLTILQFLIGCFQLPDYDESINHYLTRLMKKACEERNGFMVSWFLTKFPLNDILLNDILLNDILLNDIPEECKKFVEEVLNENEVMIKPASKIANIVINNTC